ncbi:MAG: aminotransferase class V-fold PLP-dependent enzyme, partial [Rhodothermales bacterium]|nr:aminotransferase class V-fold PLP-dependent enzyme [Rhodothermales bacterium]
MDRTFNFSAGPGVLPESALEEARDEMLVYKDAGSSVMEISHRSRQYTELAETTRSHIRELLGIGQEWHILFLQGGASQQFYQVPLNFLPDGGAADYIITGSWSAKAVKEAAKLGNARNAASSEDENFSYIPETAAWDLSDAAAYVHITSNNT